MFSKILKKFKILIKNKEKDYCDKKQYEREIIVYPSSTPYMKKGLERRKKVIYQPIHKYYIPLKIIQATDVYMRNHRRFNAECFVFWGGYLINANEAQIVTLYYPKSISSYGRVYLSTKDITLLNQALRERDQLLLVELHTHPPGASLGTEGQNSVDASNALCYHQGFISIIVPNFGYPYFYDLRNYHIFEYKSKCEWKQLNFQEIEERFIIEDSVIEVGNA